ncbi:MAG: FKBP-type peptidyl-prolyl cis-trans isomerase [Paludibacteraceae bacterium]|nr:FKBP-type peptidyl-prolyl cis-trans isomerase [Paludibacteraceae bacterium]MBQ2190515.1 FKBP-type peptidyl-prolyl cis-trans isomerase [Paludibacteraceae bacterium]MBQ4018609.1 FKBP-type peptidyl-prolyl cis-trans isomerase [Paludibacteraceae bacterium]MBQ5379083.1 FKBP-type peptidyl-prolyl cis-trans isomerase [Paludibacteraceae bacterium]
MIENQKVVSATYELYIAGEEGKEELMERATEEAPLTWCQGEGMMLPAFEAQMEGKEIGDSFDFVLAPKDAYGEYLQEGLMDLPKSMFFNGDGEFDEERVYVGAIVPMNTVDGQIVKAQVCEVTDEQVTIDLNHPYAGESLHFTGKILAIRDVTEGELKAIRNPHHCGKCHGHCGDCESDCSGNHCGQDACNNCEK